VIAVRAGVAAVAALPVIQLAGNWSEHDASRRYFAGDYAANALRQLPPNAIYFTVGDNDTFPVMYMQSAEGMRPDVTIINLSVANIPDWPEQLRRRDPSFPMSLSTTQRMDVASRPWPDTTVVIPVNADARQLALPAGTQIPPSIRLAVKPLYGGRLRPSEVLLMDIVQTNAWRRPVTFAATVGSAMEWLAPYGRVEGLYYRVVPVTSPRTDIPLLRAHLMNAQYRGYADPGVRLDDFTPRMGMLSYGGLIELLQADTRAGDESVCRSDHDALLAKLPLGRLDPPREIREPIETACGVPKS
jgi:hypothetical protein